MCRISKQGTKMGKCEPWNTYMQCSGIHRSLGVHISQVRSITLDTWLPEQVAVMQSVGNDKSNKGIGMIKEDLIKNLGTIAKSGTSDKWRSQSYWAVRCWVLLCISCVPTTLKSVISKHNDDKQYVWKSKADVASSISEDTWNELLGCGTEIRLHLKEETGEYMEESKLKVHLKTIKKKLIWKALDGSWGRSGFLQKPNLFNLRICGRVWV
ncbi:hypothetical protein LWI28_005587 [Acer negundo]|uniref:Arf-GAP domain-containing protein n=1 Tax=Acer negundo TaxID=4023 RepID=A0AAD5IUC7_ACENE|nr:hypothetical protein LWI28_005587 [Acer negundo]